MALEVDQLLKAKALTRQVWTGLIRLFDGRLKVVEERKLIDEEIADDILGRGLQVINDEIQPALDQADAKVAEIEALRVSANAIHDQLEAALEFGANTDLVTEGPGGTNRYFTPTREQAVKDDLRGAGIQAARDTLKEISDALDAEIAALKGGVSSQYDTLAEIAAAISALQTSLTAKSDVGHGHVITDTSGLQGQLDAKAAAIHTHPIADVPTASAAQFRNNTADRLLVTDDVWSAAAPVAVAYAANVALDFATGFHFEVGALTGALTLDNPVNVKPGQSGTIRLVQDATGGRTVTFGANWKAGISVSTAANAVDYLTYYARSATEIVVSMLKKGVT